MSIRIRLTLTYAAMLATILIVFSGIVVSVLHWALLNSVDRTLEQTVDEVMQNISGPRPELTLPDLQPRLTFALPDLDVFRASNVFVQAWNNNGLYAGGSTNLGDYRLPLDPDALSTTEQTLRQVPISGTTFRVLTRPFIINSRILGRIQAAASLEPIEDAQRGVATVMLVAGIIAVVFSIFLGGAMLERALRPIEAIAITASQVTTGDDLSRRIPYNGPPDELGRLVRVFNDSLGRLEALFKAQRRFVADVSHELRTPLTVIQGSVDLIKRYDDKEALDAIDSESKRMSRLVGDLLLLAQADAGGLPMSRRTMELDTLVLELLEQSRALTPEGPTIRLDRFEAVRVSADPDRLKQLFLNLIGNAIKHTPRDGVVTLSVWHTSQDALVSVADTGEGIPEEDLPHIFERFYRVDKARARAQGGAGLGLAIAQWIAEAHGGWITVRSALGQGTTFIVRLPRLVPPPETLADTALNLSIPRAARLAAGAIGNGGKQARSSAPPQPVPAPSPDEGEA